MDLWDRNISHAVTLDDTSVNHLTSKIYLSETPQLSTVVLIRAGRQTDVLHVCRRGSCTWRWSELSANQLQHADTVQVSLGCLAVNCLVQSRGDAGEARTAVSGAAEKGEGGPACYYYSTIHVIADGAFSYSASCHF
jgi:hypothetical protein